MKLRIEKNNSLSLLTFLVILRHLRTICLSQTISDSVFIECMDVLLEVYESENV
jgi:hypothetical protein